MDKDVIHDIFFKISKQVVISTVIVGRLRLSWSGNLNSQATTQSTYRE